LFASVDVFPIAPACMYQASLIGQSLSAGMNFFRLSSVGICSLSPCSTHDPRAAGYFPLNQYVGGLQLYGPSMWMPSHRSPFGPRRERRDGIHHRILPMRLGENPAVLLAHRFRRPAIASVRPDERRSVRPQHQDLRTKAVGGHAMILLAPLVPLFPLVAAHPTEHHWDPLLIGELDDVLARDLRFPAEHVDAEVLHVTQDLDR